VQAYIVNHNPIVKDHS